MRQSLAGLGFALAAAPCAYAAFVYGWQLVSFTGFAVRLDEDLPMEALGQIGLVAAQMVVIASALLVAAQGVGQRRYRKASVALGLAWLATAPLLVMWLRPF